MRDLFAKFSRKISAATGSPAALISALVFVLLWSVGGFVFGFTDTYQLIINTTTTIFTFLLVFIIQATQNRDAEAMHLKLDEILVALKQTDSRFAGLEKATQDELERRRSDLEKRR